MTGYPPHYENMLTNTQIEDNRKKALRALTRAFVSGQPKVCGSFTRKDFDGKLECCATPLFAIALGIIPDLQTWHEARYTVATDASKEVSRLLATPEEKIFTFSDHTMTFSDTECVLRAYWDMPKWAT